MTKRTDRVRAAIRDLQARGPAFEAEAAGVMGDRDRSPEWKKRRLLEVQDQHEASAASYAIQARKQALADLAGPEELRQAAHRARPILSTTPTTLLVFSPWDLAALGLSPSVTIAELPHGNAKGAAEVLAAYQARALAHTGRADSGGLNCRNQPEIQSGIDKSQSPPGLKNHPNPAITPPPAISPPREEHAPTVPASAWVAGRLCRLGQGGAVEVLDMARGWVLAPDVPAEALAQAAA